MSKYRSLSEDKLRRVCDPSFFKFMQTQGLNRKAGSYNTPSEHS
jgi:hypothetical protein